MARQLPPLNALRAFEAAGRHLSFSLAANELYVTQGAVSRQIRILESFLGEPLFVRGARGVALTEAGKRYLEITSESFDLIADGFAANPSGRRSLSVSILPSSAALWLQQKLSEFQIEHPEIRLTISASQRPVNFEQDGIDIALRVGVMPGVQSEYTQNKSDLDMVTSWNGVESVCVWQERIAPFCSKSYLDSVGGIRDANDLQRATLIHNESRPHMWASWLKANGFEHVHGASQLVLGQRYMAILAARDGRGIACVPTKDMNMLSWRDEMVQPLGPPVLTGNGYYVLFRHEGVRQHEVQLLCNWIQSMMAAVED